MVDFIKSCAGNHLLAKWLLYQSGPLTEFGELEPGDQIEIVSFEVDIFEIKIVARLGDQERVFNLKVMRI